MSITAMFSLNTGRYLTLQKPLSLELRNQGNPEKRSAIRSMMATSSCRIQLKMKQLESVLNYAKSGIALSIPGFTRYHVVLVANMPQDSWDTI